jgi:hypothetical protein
MSAEDLYEDPVWWSSDELQEYCEEVYGEEEGREMYEELMDCLSDGEMAEGHGRTTVVWGDETEPILGQMEMDNHLVYRVEDEEALVESVYEGGHDMFYEEADVDDAG